MRISNYLEQLNIYDEAAHSYRTLLFSTRSARTRVLDTHIWSTLQRGEFSTIAAPVIEDLKDCQVIIDDQEDELKSILDENRQAALDSRQLYYAIQATAACPLGCGYCGQKHSSQRLGNKEEKNLLDYIDLKLSSGKFDSLAIGWFGAEPLASVGRVEKLSKELIALAEKHKVSYSAQMTTNGLYLSESIIPSLVSDCQITSYELTIDGVEEAHDARRHTKTKQPTFQRIFKNLVNLVHHPLVESKCRISLRCNVDHRNAWSVDPFIAQLAENGLQKKLHFYIAPIHGWGNGAEDLALSKDEFSSMLVGWYISMIEAGFSFNLLPRRVKELCMATSTDNELIDPFGNRFNCTEVSLVPSYENNGINQHAIGHVTKSQETPDRKFRDFYQKVEQDELPCHSCKMLPVCGGACPKEWAEGHIPCPPPKHNIQQLLLLAYNKGRLQDIDVSTDSRLFQSADIEKFFL